VNGKRKAFHKGGNSSCRLHLRQHYKLYEERCKEANIPINHWAVPREIWRVMQAAKESVQQGVQTKKKIQQGLDFENVTGPREFTRAGVLHAVAKLIASNNQVSSRTHFKSDKFYTPVICSLSRWRIMWPFEILSLQCAQNPPPGISRAPTTSRYTYTTRSSSTWSS
jgi:hypothetical protein